MNYVKDAEQHFGITQYKKEAFYIMPDGKWLDGSGRHWDSSIKPNSDRSVDHFDVLELDWLSHTDRLDSWLEFMRLTDAARCDMIHGIFGVMNSSSKYYPILVNSFCKGAKGKYVAMAIYDKFGHIVAEIEFDSAQPKKMLAWLQEHYQDKPTKIKAAVNDISLDKDKIDKLLHKYIFEDWYNRPLQDEILDNYDQALSLYPNQTSGDIYRGCAYSRDKLEVCLSFLIKLIKTKVLKTNRVISFTTDKDIANEFAYDDPVTIYGSEHSPYFGGFVLQSVVHKSSAIDLDELTDRGGGNIQAELLLSSGTYKINVISALVLSANYDGNAAYYYGATSKYFLERLKRRGYRIVQYKSLTDFASMLLEYQRNSDRIDAIKDRLVF